MSLSPLLDVIARDPGVAAAVAVARGGEPATDVSVAPGGRPALLAALVRDGGPQGAAPAPARHHGHDPGGRGPRSRPAAASSPPTASPTSPRGRRCRTSGSARAATPSASGSRCCAGSRHPDPERRGIRPARRSSSRRCARCSSRSSKGLGELMPGRPPGRRRAPRSSRSSRPSPPRPTPAPTSSSGAASSPCAAASSTSSRPPRSTRVRVEFWGDTVEEIRWFKVADQRSLEVAEHGLWAPPCRELLLTDAVRERAARARRPAARRRRPARQARRGHRRRGHGVPRPGPRRRHGDAARRPAARAPCVVLCDPERVRTRAHDLVATSQEFLDAGWANAAAGNAVPDRPPGASSARRPSGRLAELRAHARERGLPWWDLTPFAADAELADGDSSALESGLGDDPALPRQTPTDAVARPAPAGSHDGWRVVVVTEGHGLAKRVNEVLARARRARAGSTPTDADLGAGPRPPSPPAPSGAGFLAPGSRLAVVTETDLTGHAGPGRRPPRTCAGCRRGAATRSTRSSCSPGDFVVHEQHGVGRFVEMMQRTVAGATREYLVSSTPRPSAASPATGSTCPPTSSTRSPTTSAASSPPSTRWAAPTGTRPRRGPSATSSRSPPS